MTNSKNTLPLQRQLLYTERQSMNDFLKESALNELLYDTLMESRLTGYTQVVPAIVLFNEAYYQCTRILADDKPVEAVFNEYYYRTMKGKEEQSSDILVCLMVYAILSLREEPAAYGYTLDSPRKYMFIHKERARPFYELVRIQRMNRKMYCIDLSPRPTPPFQIVADAEAWREVTKDFNPDEVSAIRNRYSTDKDKMDLILLINNAMRKPTQPDNYDECTALKEEIAMLMKRLEDQRSLKKELETAQSQYKKISEVAEALKVELGKRMVAVPQEQFSLDTLVDIAIKNEEEKQCETLCNLLGDYHDETGYEVKKQRDKLRKAVRDIRKGLHTPGQVQINTGGGTAVVNSEINGLTTSPQKQIDRR